MKQLLIRWKEKRRLKKLIKQAEHQREMTGKQYFVVPVVTRGIKQFMLMNNEMHKKYNRTAKKMHKAQIRYDELLRMAVYKTKAGAL